MSTRVRIAEACALIAKKELERGWAKRGSKKSEADAIALLAEAREAIRR